MRARNENKTQKPQPKIKKNINQKSSLFSISSQEKHPNFASTNLCFRGSTLGAKKLGEAAPNVSEAENFCLVCVQHETSGENKGFSRFRVAAIRSFTAN
jgi:hypothetical protein